MKSIFVVDMHLRYRPNVNQEAEVSPTEEFMPFWHRESKVSKLMLKLGTERESCPLCNAQRGSRGWYSKNNLDPEDAASRNDVFRVSTTQQATTTPIHKASPRYTSIPTHQNLPWPIPSRRIDEPRNGSLVIAGLCDSLLRNAGHSRNKAAVWLEADTDDRVCALLGVGDRCNSGWGFPHQRVVSLFMCV
jgi:hypothetical protein